MSWLWLKAVPWGTIISNGPTIVDGARKLLDRRSATGDLGDATATDPAALAQRLRVAELRQQEMLDLIDKLANSNEQLSEAVTYLRARAALNFRLAIVLAVIVATLVVHLVMN